MVWSVWDLFTFSDVLSKTVLSNAVRPFAEWWTNRNSLRTLLTRWWSRPVPDFSTVRFLWTSDSCRAGRVLLWSAAAQSLARQGFPTNRLVPRHCDMLRRPATEAQRENEPALARWDRVCLPSVVPAVDITPAYALTVRYINVEVMSCTSWLRKLAHAQL